MITVGLIHFTLKLGKYLSHTSGKVLEMLHQNQCLGGLGMTEIDPIIGELTFLT